MSFLPNQIGPGGISTLQYTLHNANEGFTLFDVGFDNTFPAGISVASPLLYSISPECGTPDFTPAIGAGSVTFTNATILGGDDCVINLNVSAADIGQYTNITTPVSSASGGGNTASAILSVGSVVYMPLIKR